jgi:hypothetical protein
MTSIAKLYYMLALVTWLMVFNSFHPFKKVLGCYNSKDYPRESCSTVFRFELESVRPEPHAPLEDYRYRLTLMPNVLRLFLLILIEFCFIQLIQIKKSGQVL